jgi:hypothetical protein
MEDIFGGAEMIYVAISRLTKITDLHIINWKTGVTNLIRKDKLALLIKEEKKKVLEEYSKYNYTELHEEFIMDINTAIKNIEDTF